MSADNELINNLKNETLRSFLQYVEETESPRLFHIWSFISGVAASLGRRSYLRWGDDKLYPNMYVVIVGPPATRKNTAINIVKKMVRNNCVVRFAPDDTSGQRQGLIRSLVEDLEGEDEDDEIANLQGTALLEKVAATQLPFDEDKNCMYAVATEFSSFIGQKSDTLITFLLKLFDGEDYEYTLKNEKTTLRDPLLNILAATTSTSLSSTLPAEAIGQGFMSRLILVYGRNKYKSIPRPKPLPDNLKYYIENQLHEIQTTVYGEFTETPEAEEYLNNVYFKKIDMNDHRFTYYLERRHTHLIKLGMVLAACRKSKTITLADYEEANLILAYTEVGMPDALGEFGLSPISLAIQRMMEFLLNANEPVGANLLWTIMQKDMKLVDFHNAMANLENAGKIVKFVRDQKEYIVAARNQDDDDTDPYKMLLEELLTSDEQIGEDE